MSKIVKRLTTIGYEGLKPAELIASLRSAGVRVLIDVRELPLSRRKGFSKTALAEYLSAHKIKYLHLRDLGDPKPGRDAARAGDYGAFRKIYAAHLRTARAQSALDEAAQIAAKNTSCLLCYERNPVHCHRSVVAGLIGARARLSIQHLVFEQADRGGRKDRQRASIGVGQSLAAAE